MPANLENSAVVTGPGKFSFHSSPKERQCFPIFGCKEYNPSDLSIEHLVMSMCRVFSCFVGRGYLLWSVCSRRFESPLDCKKINPVNPKGNQSWIFIGGTGAEAETPVLWPPDAKNWLIGKDPDAGKDWGQEEKGMTGDEMAGWHHRLNGHEF